MLTPLDLDGPSYSVPEVPPKPPPTLRHRIFVAWVILSCIFLLWVGWLASPALARQPKVPVVSQCPY